MPNQSTAEHNYYYYYAVKLLKTPADSSERFDDTLTGDCGVIPYCNGTCNNQLKFIA